MGNFHHFKVFTSYNIVQSIKIYIFLILPKITFDTTSRFWYWTTHIICENINIQFNYVDAQNARERITTLLKEANENDPPINNDKITKEMLKHLIYTNTKKKRHDIKYISHQKNTLALSITVQR